MPAGDCAVQIVVAPELAPHVAVAMEHHLQRCRQQGVAVPRGLTDLRDWAQVVQRGLSPPSPVPTPDDRPVVLLLSIPAAADLLGCSASTVKRLIAAGQLQPVLLGGVRRLRRADIEAFVEGLAGGSFRDRVEAKEPA